MRIHSLRRHRLTHLPDLKVDPKIFGTPFRHDCSLRNCNAQCCRRGVYVDLNERDLILAHADAIVPFLQPHQRSDPAAWFEEKVFEEPDFPSRRCVGTVATVSGCVFLDEEGLCTLQKASEAMGGGAPDLKPFYCTAYPITIESGVLTVEDPAFTHREVCCSRVSDGTQTVFDVYSTELKFVLGEPGFNELHDLAPA